MKIRIGFVSNSSSSSFCVAKCYMTPEQVQQFREWLVEEENELYETYIHEGEHYFFGEISVHDEEVNKFLGAIGVDMQYVEEAG